MFASFSKGGSCFPFMQDCFKEKTCKNEFLAVFDNCIVPDNYEIYSGECIYMGYLKSESSHSKNLIKCLDDKCNVMFVHKVEQ